ncbi:hypothetical protein TIFTF001_027472 [Ficus carica]|uniref:Uncharacterized protein n=1 Tax=Ficus carica TaxID=3494 RepID=A0AA88DN38_FICCA|nr:hypothetical protein TIFTF001_027472 [Ficus carica]
MLLRARKEWKYGSTSSAPVKLGFNTEGRGVTSSSKLIISEASSMEDHGNNQVMSFSDESDFRDERNQRGVEII